MNRVCVARLLVITMFLASPICAAPRFEPPGESAELAETRKAAEGLIDQGRLADAMGDVDKMLANQPGGLVCLDEGHLISGPTWLETLSSKQRKALAAEYRGRFDPAAKDALEALRQQPAAAPEQFYQLGQRYPLTSAAAPAYLEAAGRASRLGDAPAAAAFFDLVQRSGWKADGEQALTAAMARLMSGAPAGNVPPEIAQRAAAVMKRAAWEQKGFDGSWYTGSVCSLPAASGGVLYFAGAKDVLAVRENGEIVWRWVSSARGGAERNGDRRKPDFYTPALFNGAGGAQIVLVCQPRNYGENWCLRAFRASDGKLLWSTEDNPATDRLSLVGRVVVAGRYVYGLAVQTSEDFPRLVLAAFDVLDGHVIYTTVLVNVLEQWYGPGERAIWDDLWEQGEPAVAGDAVYLTPSVGLAFCVGRFDGRIRWLRIYEQASEGRVWRDPHLAAPHERRALTPPPRSTQRVRLRGAPVVCGNVVVIAPQDSQAVLGLDCATGRLLWSNPALADRTLRTSTATVAVLSSNSAVESLDATTGKSLWRYSEAIGQSRPAGPPSLVGSLLFIPTADTLVHAVNPESGASAAPAFKPVSLRQILSVAATKKALEDAGIVTATRR